jgi:hypothetical protein
MEEFIESKNDLLDFEEEYQDLENFYETQFQTWQRLSASLNQRFARNRKALEKDESALAVLTKLQTIYEKARPYREIRDVDPLIETINKVNQKLIDDKREHAQMRIDARIERVKQQLEEAALPQNLSNEALSPLQQTKMRIAEQDSLAEINQEVTDAADLEDDAYDLINTAIKKQESDARAALEKVADLPADTGNGPHADASTNKTDKQKITEPPKVKPVTTIAPSKVFDKLGLPGFIETEDQIEQYLAVLRDQLSTAISQNHKVRIK